MNRKELIAQIREKQSFLCVGLDTDINKIPQCIIDEAKAKDGDEYIFRALSEFNALIIDATAPYCVAYKPNLAFYEAYGVDGILAFEATVDYLKEEYPNHFIIADAKRGDIGNTSKMYAKTFFEEYDVDALTVAPYMGEDSVTPFLGYDDKWVILLALTSNKGSYDFQLRMFEDIRKVAPTHFLLVPGVGAQGGSLQEVCQYGMTKDCGLLVNSSRGIIYASNGEDFAEVAAQKAKELQEQMAEEIKKRM